MESKTLPTVHVYSFSKADDKDQDVRAVSQDCLQMARVIELIDRG